MKLLLRFWFFGAMPKFFFGIGGGASGDEKAMFKLLANLGTYGTQKGQGATNQALDYFSAFLSGDPTKISQAIAPETKVIQGMAEQKKKQNAEFGTRSGGTAASNANIDTNTLSQITDLVNRSRAAAAGEVAGIGSNLLNLGGSSAASGFTAAKTIQDQEKARWDDIFKSIASIAMGFSGTSFGGAMPTPTGRPDSAGLTSVNV